MSDTPLPTYVDARKVFSQNASMRGAVELKKLERVADCVTDDKGAVTAAFDFRLDSAGKRRIRGQVAASVMLTCQRCLEPVAVDLHEEFDLVLVADEEATRSLDKALDPWICADHKIVLARILDEQILLGMPIVSYHQQGPCSQRKGFEAAPEPLEIDDSRVGSPFAVLADLNKE